MSHKNALVQVQGHEHLPAPVERRSPSLVEDMEVARMLAESQLLPQAYRGRVGDALVAVHIARDLGVSPYLVLTNLSFVNGKPSWSTPFLIARANASGVFSEELSWEVQGEGDKMAVTCSAVLARSGKRVSKTITMAQARADGWTRNNKYASIGEQMLSYRAAVFLIRLYCPGILYGIRPADENEDIEHSSGRTVEVSYEPPEPSSSPPAPARRASPVSAAQSLPGGESGAPGAISSVEAPPGAGLALPAEGSTPSSSRPLSPAPTATSDLGSGSGDTSSPSSPSALDGPQTTSGTSSAPTGQDGPGDWSPAVEAAVRAHLLRYLGPEGDLETVDAWRAAQVPSKPPLRSLPPKHREVSMKWFEVAGSRDRYLAWVAEQQRARQTQREDGAVREALLAQAREVLRELPADAAEEALERLGVATVDGATEAQLRKLVTLGRGGVQ